MWFSSRTTFFLGIVKPRSGYESKIIAEMTNVFMDIHMKDMYSKDTDEAGQEGGDEFHPFVLVNLTSPIFLMSK